MSLAISLDLLFFIYSQRDHVGWRAMLNSQALCRARVLYLFQIVTLSGAMKAIETAGKSISPTWSWSSWSGFRPFVAMSVSCTK